MSEDAKLSYTIGNFTVVPTTPTTEIKSYCTSSAGQRAFVEDTISCYQFFHGLFGKWNTHRKEKLGQEEELEKLYGSANIPSPQKRNNKNWKKFLTLYLVLGTIVLVLLLALLFHRTKTVERIVTEIIYKGKGAETADIADTDRTRKGKKEREGRREKKEKKEKKGKEEEKEKKRKRKKRQANRYR